MTADDKAGLAEVRRASAVPIATGESEFTRHDFREIAELRGADVLQPDLAIAGGITEGVRIGAIASAFNLRLAPHLWSGAPAFAAGRAPWPRARARGSSSSTRWARNPLLHELVGETFPVVDGMLVIPDRPDSASPSTRTSSAVTRAPEPRSIGPRHARRGRDPTGDESLDLRQGAEAPWRRELHPARRPIGVSGRPRRSRSGSRWPGGWSRWPCPPRPSVRRASRRSCPAGAPRRCERRCSSHSRCWR